MTSKFRKSAENAIWLCRDHGKAVDDDVDVYTIEQLREWKRDAIDYAQRCIAARTIDVDGRLKEIFATRHKLAREFTLAVSKLNLKRRAVAASFREWQAPKLGDGEHARARLSTTEQTALADAISALQNLEHDLQAVFGDEVASVATQLRAQSQRLERYVAARFTTETMEVVAAAAMEDEPLYGGHGHEKWMEGLTALIHEWSGVWLGRDGAALMSQTNLAKKADMLRARAAEDGHREWCELHDTWDQRGDEAAYAEYWERHRPSSTRRRTGERSVGEVRDRPVLLSIYDWQRKLEKAAAGEGPSPTSGPSPRTIEEQRDRPLCLGLKHSQSPPMASPPSSQHGARLSTSGSARLAVADPHGDSPR